MRWPFPSLGWGCPVLPPADHHRTHPVPVHTRLPTSSVSLDRRTFRRSSCGLLVPGERESLSTSSRQCGDTSPSQTPPFACPHLSPRRSGLALNSWSASPPALPDAESPLLRSLYHREADKWGHLSPATPSPVLYSPCIPHLTSQALLALCPRHQRTGSYPSSQSSRGTLHLPSTRNLGLSSTGRPLAISYRLGSLRAGREVLGWPRMFNKHKKKIKKKSRLHIPLIPPVYSTMY